MKDTSLLVFDGDDAKRMFNPYENLPYLNPRPEEMPTGVMALYTQRCWTGSILVRISVKIDSSRFNIIPNSKDGRYVDTIYFRPGGYVGGCASQCDRILYQLLNEHTDANQNRHRTGPCHNCRFYGDNFKTMTYNLINLIFNSPVHPDSLVYIEHKFDPTYAYIIRSTENRIDNNKLIEYFNRS